jgi:Ni,Fe-hydrogenase III large subunit
MPEKLAPGRLAIAAVEAWRGEVVCAAVSGDDGSLKKIKLIDPSFHNWFALALALRGEQISNFPICNKSFNLSYCGHDL